MKLYLDEKTHRYYDAEGTIYTSCTTQVGRFTTKFQSDIIAKSCVKIGQNPEHPSYDKYKNKTKEEILAKWNELREKGINRGNEIHSYLEHTIKLCTNFYNQDDRLEGELLTIDNIKNYSGKLNYELFENMTIEYPLFRKLIYLLHKSGFEFFAEVAVYDVELGIAGLIDLIAVKDNKYHIIDYKTNSTPITKESGYFKKDFEGNIIGDFIKVSKKMKAPVNHLYDTTYNKYSLQVNAYNFLVNKTTGMDSLGNMIIHIMPEEIKLITIPLIKNEVIDILKHKELIGFDFFTK